MFVNYVEIIHELEQHVSMSAGSTVNAVQYYYFNVERVLYVPSQYIQYDLHEVKHNYLGQDCYIATGI